MCSARLTLTALLFVSLCRSAASAQPAPREPGKPGVFDYYVLALLWSPEYCAGPSGASSTEQCGEYRRFGFVVHGLWPQYEAGWPQDCAVTGPVDRALVDSMLPLMPSSQLIQHEWAKHGTCSGLTQREYFGRTRKAFHAITVPDSFKQPLEKVEISPAEFKEKFLAANPGLSADSVRMSCRGRYLSEVQVCFSKDLTGRKCGADVRDRCSAPMMIMRPLQ